jgi:hypothetical protein
MIPRLHPEDARFLRRSLRNNLLCCLAITAFVLAIRSEQATTLSAAKRAQADSPTPAIMVSDSPPETQAVLLTSTSPIARAPEGWRRTEQGWEHVSNWSLPRSLGDIIESQQRREPVWAQFTLDLLNAVPPLVYGLIQIAAITVIVNIGGRRKRGGCVNNFDRSATG